LLSPFRGVGSLRAVSGVHAVICRLPRQLLGASALSKQLTFYYANSLVRIKVEGIRNAFGEMVAIQYAVLSLCFALYFFGKRIRGFTAGFGPMKEVLTGR
jgi:hypothetical protein